MIISTTCSFLTFNFATLWYNKCCYFCDKLFNDRYPVPPFSTDLPPINEEKETNQRFLEFVWRSTMQSQPFHGNKGNPLQINNNNNIKQ